MLDNYSLIFNFECNNLCLDIKAESFEDAILQSKDVKIENYIIDYNEGKLKLVGISKIEK